MSLNSIMSIATSGLITAQTGLSVTSDNIANVGTPGYVRKIIDQVSLVSGGMGAGVTVADIRRAANLYLQRASLEAGADAGRTGVIADMLDRAQSLFGDPSADTGYFNQLNQVFTDLSSTAADPSSGLPRSQALGSLGTFLDQSQRIGASINGLEGEADTRIGADVQQVNQLLAQIDKLNIDITRASVAGGDATGSENTQSQLINQLSTLMDVQVSARGNGGVNVRMGDGTLLAGDGAATLAYTPSSGGVGQMTVTPAGAGAVPVAARIGGGELKGLLDLRNTLLPGAADQLGEFVSRAVGALNAAHNASSSVPPPATLTGRNTGLDLPTAVGGFSGKTTVAILDANGVVQQRVDIDFTAGTMSANGGAATAFTPASFLSSLNTSLGGAGTASFSNGALSISASGSGNGVAIADDATTPSAKAGEGFSQFFGLNDLISSSGFSNYQTGLTASDTGGFGGTIALRLTDSSGGSLADVSVALPAGGTMADVLAALNAPGSGVGAYGQFSLDAQGTLGFTPSTTSNAQISVLSDTSQRGAGGPSLSGLFGIGDAQRASRTASFSIRSDIAANPSRLALAQLNLSAPAGQPALAVGDGRGGVALGSAGDAISRFDPAGTLGSIQTSISQYAAQFGGTLGRQAAAADGDNTVAQAVQSEADSRRSSAEGVNLDQELINLTTYQQAYNASARLIQTSKDLFDVLMGMGR